MLLTAPGIRIALTYYHKDPCNPTQDQCPSNLHEKRAHPRDTRSAVMGRSHGSGEIYDARRMLMC
jgi:hypothetical protein